MIMAHFTYNKDKTQSQVESLPFCSCVAFGLSCCERLFPNYTAFHHEVNWGDAKLLRKALDGLWEIVEGKEISTDKISGLIGECESTAPDSEDFTSPLVAAAQDACFAICAVLDYVLQKDPERIAQASSFAIDTLDRHVQDLLGGDSNSPTLVPVTPGREEKIRLHPLMQRELSRQAADLKLLAGNPNLKTLKSQWCAPSKSNLDIS